MIIQAFSYKTSGQQTIVRSVNNLGIVIATVIPQEDFPPTQAKALEDLLSFFQTKIPAEPAAELVAEIHELEMRLVDLRTRAGQV